MSSDRFFIGSTAHVPGQKQLVPTVNAAESGSLRTDSLQPAPIGSLHFYGNMYIAAKFRNVLDPVE